MRVLIAPRVHEYVCMWVRTQAKYELEALESSARQRLEALAVQHREELERIPPQQKEAMTQLNFAHVKKLGQHDSKSTEDREKLQQQHAQKRERLQVKAATVDEQLVCAHSLRLEQRRVQQEEECVELGESHAQQTASLQKRHAEAGARLERQHQQQLRALEARSFLGAWNWVDAFMLKEYASGDSIDSAASLASQQHHPETYLMLRQSMMARRAVILIEHIEHTRVAREQIERHVLEVLAQQGHIVVVVTRHLYGSGQVSSHYHKHRFHVLTLCPLSEQQQQRMIEQRLDAERAVALHNYILSRLPVDPQTSSRMTADPFVLSEIISVFESHQTDPDIVELFDAMTMALLMHDVDEHQSEPPVPTESDSSMVPQSDASKEDGDELAGAYGGLESEDQGEAGDPEDVARRLTMSLLQEAFFRAHMMQQRVVNEHHLQAALQRLLDGPSYAAVPHVLGALRTRVASGEERLPLVRLLHLEDGRGALQGAQTLARKSLFRFQAAHLSFQEFFVAQAICQGIQLAPEEPLPWHWDEWMANAMTLGTHMGPPFRRGLLLTSGLAPNAEVNLAGRLGGHRPTALRAVALIMQEATAINLSRNRLGVRLADEEQEVGVLWSRMTGAVRTSQTLRSLNVGHNALKEDLVIALVKALAQNPLCTSIDVAGNLVGLDGGQALADYAASSGTLSDLRIDSDRALPIKKLKGTEPAESLTLQGMGFKVASAAVIATLIKTNAAVTALNLADNPLGAKAGLVLADAVRANTSLTALDLSFTDLGDVGVSSLAKGLQLNDSLIMLTLQGRYKGDNIGPRGAVALADAIANGCNSLLELNLGINCLRDKGAAVIADALRESEHPLRSLILANNKVGAVGSEAIAAYIHASSSLTALDARFNVFSSASRQRIKDSIMRRERAAQPQIRTTGMSAENAVVVLSGYRFILQV